MWLARVPLELGGRAPVLGLDLVLETRFGKVTGFTSGADSTRGMEFKGFDE